MSRVPNQDNESKPTNEQRDAWLRETDRKRGLLTRDDRKFLIGETDTTGQAKYNTKYRIKQRVKRGLRDIAFIRRAGHQALFSSALEDLTDDPKLARYVALYILEAGMILSQTQDQIYGEQSSIPAEERLGMSDMLESALYYSYNRLPRAATVTNVDVSVDVDSTTHDLDQLEKRIVYNEVTEPELRTYLKIRGRDDLKKKLEKQNETIRVYIPSLDTTSQIEPEDLPDETK
jgi:hypothetical protein